MKWIGYNRNSQNNPFLPRPGKPVKPHFMYAAHQNKERAYVDALEAAGYKGYTIEKLKPRFALFDLDVNRRSSILDRMHARGVPVFLYPHAARPAVHWDGMHPVWPHTRCTFVIARGHREVMERFGYPLPIEVVGWTYCPIKPFEPVKEVGSILFGPIHPSARGWIADVDRELNQKAHARLVEYCRDSGVRLVVRHIKELALSGLKKEPGVTYIEGKPDQTITEIDAADVVVGHQTFAYLAVARGKPTLMMGEDIPPRTVVHGAVAYVKSWEKYADIMMYPVDILAGDTEQMIAQACRRNAKVTEWRKRFIGEPFDPKVFVEKLEAYL